MEEMLIYQGKVAIAFMVFFIAFAVLFNRWKNFRFNRLYLLGSMIISFILPLITFTIVREVAPTFVYFESSGNEIYTATTVAPQNEFNIQQILLKIYFAGVAFFVARLLAGHLKAISILLKSREKQINGIPLYIYADEIHPFAFFNKVVVPETVIHGNAFHMILNHEMFHIRENHWLDNLTSELLCAVQWFNPFAWMMKGALKRNLEFQADHKVIASHNAETYQMALVSMANTQGPGTFLTALNSSDLKTRIKMMKMKTENKFGVVRQLVVLPLLAFLVMGLANREVKTLTTTPQPISVIDYQNGSSDTPATSTNGQDNWRDMTKDSNDTIPIHSEQSLIVKDTGDYYVKGKIVDVNREAISGVAIIIQGGALGAITDARGDFLLQLKNPDADLIVKKPGFQTQVINADVQKEINIILFPEFSEEGNKQLATEVINNQGTRGFVIWAKNEDLPPLLIVDDEVVEDITHLTPENISSVTVLKDNKAIEKFGDKGVNGVILITTKDYVSQRQQGTNQDIAYERQSLHAKPGFSGGTEAIARYSGKANGGAITGQTQQAGFAGSTERLILVNGKVFEEDINSIDPNTIQSIDVLKGQSGEAHFGERGKNGVIMITLKSGENSANNNTDPSPASAHVKPEKNTAPQISTIQQLRQHIAERIRYPVSAQEAGQTEKIELYAEIGRDGKISQLSETAPADPFETVDEVVIISYASENLVSTTVDFSKLLKDESIRVIHTFPKIEIPEYQGKWVKFQFSFLLE
jgi:beta-lactamase regulating signal transducer with metallopeptidase domain